MDLLLHFKVNEGDENNINIQEYMLYGDVETKSEKCLVDEGDEVVLTSARNRQKEINKILDTSGNENSKVVVEDDLEEERNESCMEL